jgi:protein-disulfide isomerase
MKKPAILFVLVVGVLIVAGSLALRASRAASTPGGPAPASAAAAPAGAPAAMPVAAPRVEDPKAVYRVPLEDSPARGPRDALVTIVESVDFECPFCKRVAPTLKQLAEAYRGKVRFVFKSNPLSMHRNALPAAALAEEARAQGGDAKFWALHDALLEAPTLDRPALERAAAHAGLAKGGVRAALDGGKYLDRIRRDQNLLNALAASGTPAFFVNGRKLVGAQPLEAFKALVDEELAKAEALVSSGVAPRDVYARTVERGATAPVLIARADVRPAAEVRIRADDPARGGARAPVTIVEFSDFQCPFCARALPAIADAERAFGADVRLVFKHLPLPFHPNATPAAIAAEAAREQGKFWEMHDLLFSHQQELSEAAYDRFARELGLDVERFQAARRAPSTAERVRADVASATAAGVTGTPTFLVNGELVLGGGGLRAAVERQLQRARVAGR